MRAARGTLSPLSRALATGLVFLSVNLQLKLRALGTGSVARDLASRWESETWIRWSLSKPRSTVTSVPNGSARERERSPRKQGPQQPGPEQDPGNRNQSPGRACQEECTP